MLNRTGHTGVSLLGGVGTGRVRHQDQAGPAMPAMPA